MLQERLMAWLYVIFEKNVLEDIDLYIVLEEFASRGT